MTTLEEELSQRLGAQMMVAGKGIKDEPDVVVGMQWWGVSYKDGMREGFLKCADEKEAVRKATEMAEQSDPARNATYQAVELQGLVGVYRTPIT